MVASVALFLAAIVFGLGFGLGTAIINGLIGLVHRGNT